MITCVGAVVGLTLVGMTIVHAGPMKNALGGWSLALGILSVMFFWLPILGLFAYVTAVVGAVFGWFGMRRAVHGVASNSGTAAWGFALSLVGLACVVVMTVWWLGNIT